MDPYPFIRSSLGPTMRRLSDMPCQKPRIVNIIRNAGAAGASCAQNAQQNSQCCRMPPPCMPPPCMPPPPCFPCPPPNCFPCCIPPLMRGLPPLNNEPRPPPPPPPPIMFNPSMLGKPHSNQPEAAPAFNNCNFYLGDCNREPKVNSKVLPSQKIAETSHAKPQTVSNESNPGTVNGDGLLRQSTGRGRSRESEDSCMSPFSKDTEYCPSFGKCNIPHRYNTERRRRSSRPSEKDTSAPAMPQRRDCELRQESRKSNRERAITNISINKPPPERPIVPPSRKSCTTTKPNPCCQKCLARIIEREVCLRLKALGLTNPTSCTPQKSDACKSSTSLSSEDRVENSGGTGSPEDGKSHGSEESPEDGKIRGSEESPKDGSGTFSTESSTSELLIETKSNDPEPDTRARPTVTQTVEEITTRSYIFGANAAQTQTISGQPAFRSEALSTGQLLNEAPDATQTDKNTRNFGNNPRSKAARRQVNDYTSQVPGAVQTQNSAYAPPNPFSGGPSGYNNNRCGNYQPPNGQIYGDNQQIQPQSTYQTACVPMCPPPPPIALAKPSYDQIKRIAVRESSDKCVRRKHITFIRKHIRHESPPSGQTYCSPEQFPELQAPVKEPLHSEHLSPVPKGRSTHFAQSDGLRQQHSPSPQTEPQGQFTETYMKKTVTSTTYSPNPNDPSYKKFFAANPPGNHTTYEERRSDAHQQQRPSEYSSNVTNPKDVNTVFYNDKSKGMYQTDSSSTYFSTPKSKKKPGGMKGKKSK